VIGDATEDIGELGLWIDAIQLGGLDVIVRRARPTGDLSASLPSGLSVTSRQELVEPDDRMRVINQGHSRRERKHSGTPSQKLGVR
jgi:hypothetical protein